MSRLSRERDAVERPSDSPAGQYPPGFVEAIQGINDTLDRIAKGPYTGEGVPLRGARYVELAPAVSSVGTLARPVSSPCKLLGWSFYEESGNNIVANLFDGDTNHVVGGISLAANGATTQWFGDKGIAVLHALRVSYVSGNGILVGSVFVDQS